MGKEDSRLVDTVTTENYRDAIARVGLFIAEDVTNIQQLTDLNRVLSGEAETLGVGESLGRIIVANGHQEPIDRGDPDGDSMRVIWRFSLGDPLVRHYAEIMEGMIRIHTHHDTGTLFSVSIPAQGNIVRDMSRPDPISDLPGYAYGTREGVARYLPANQPANPEVMQKYATNLQIASRNILTASRPPSTRVPHP